METVYSSEWENGDTGERKIKVIVELVPKYLISEVIVL